jgi:hypothetical protein
MVKQVEKIVNEVVERTPLPAMDIVRKPFLFTVGAVAVAYEEATKAIRDQQERLNERFNRQEA